MDFEEYKKSQLADEAKLNLRFGVKENPDTAAEANQLATRYELPADLVKKYKPEYAEEAAVDDAAAAMQQSDALQKWLAQKPYHAEISHDDLDNTGLLGRALSTLGKIKDAGVSGLRQKSAGTYGIMRAPLDIIADTADALGLNKGEYGQDFNVAGNLSKDIAGLQNEIKGRADAQMPKGDGWISSGAYSGVASLTNNLAGLPLALLPGGQGAALGTMVAPVFGEEYGKAKDAGKGTLPAITYGSSQAAIEYWTEKLPVSWLVRDLKVGAPFYKLVVNQMAAEIPGEQVATILQDMNEWAVINPDKTLNEFVNERPGAAVQTLVATIVGTGGQITVMKGIDIAAGRISAMSDKAARAEESAKNIDAIHQLVAANKVLQRDPAAFESFIEAASDGGPVQDIYIGAHELYQSGMAEQLAEVSPSIKAQLESALVSGGDVRIPIAEYTSKIAGTEYNQGLIDHIKVGPNEMSRAEAAEFMATRSDEIKQAFDAAVGEQSKSEEFVASRDRVRDIVKSELEKSGRFSTEKSEIEATLFAARTAVRAAQIGITPEQMYRKQPLFVRSEFATENEPVANYNQPAYGEDTTGGNENGQDSLDFTGAKGGVRQKTFGTTVAGLPAKPDFAENTWVRGAVPGGNGEEGPIAVWRGEGRKLTPKDFEYESLGYASGSPASARGVYFSTRKSLGEKHGVDAGGETNQYFLDIRKPYKLHHSQLEAEYKNIQTKEEYFAYREALRDQGYDAIIIDQTDIGGGHDIIAFTPDQVILSRNNDEYFQKKGGNRDQYTQDLFGNKIPEASGENANANPEGRPSGDLQSDDKVKGKYATQTEIISETSREIGIDKVSAAADAAQAMAFLSRNTVEHFDALVTDKDGKPLAIVGSFKGAISEAQIYPHTLVYEAFRIQGAANIWFAHNHPSGNAELSNADKRLNSALANAFRGSRIKARGIMAIGGADRGGRSWSLQDENGDTTSGTTAKPSSSIKVPIVERIFKVEGTLGPNATSMKAARIMAKEVSGGKNGVILTNAQNEPIAFVPLEAGENNVLRADGKMDELYRSLSMANASAAFIYSDGKLSEREIMNVSSLLRSMDARPLDVFEPHNDGGHISWAEQGRNIGLSEFYQSPRVRHFSQLSEAIKTAPEKIFSSGKSVASWLKANKAKLGIKDDELFWTGVNDWLDTQPKVTRAEVQAYLESNGVQVRDVMLGVGDLSTEEEVRYLELNGLNNRGKLAGKANKALADEYFDLRARRNVRAAKFATYQLPGGENYRELLLTLPEKQKKETWEWFDPETQESEQGFATQQDAYDARPSISAIVSKVEAKDSPQNFRSSHFDQPNILAHIRFNERTDADGKRVLFLEEIQSDFGQSFKKQKDAISKAVDSDFVGIIERMKKAGVLEVNCD